MYKSQSTHFNCYNIFYFMDLPSFKFLIPTLKTSKEYTHTYTCISIFILTYYTHLPNALIPLQFFSPAISEMIY